MLIREWGRRARAVAPHMHPFAGVEAVNRTVTEQGEGGVDKATEKQIADALIIWQGLVSLDATYQDMIRVLGRLGWLEHSETMKQGYEQVAHLLANFEAEANQCLGLKP